MDERLAGRFAVGEHRGLWVAAIWIATGILAAGGQLVIGDEATVLSRVSLRSDGPASASGRPTTVRVVTVAMSDSTAESSGEPPSRPAEGSETTGSDEPGSSSAADGRLPTLEAPIVSVAATADAAPAQPDVVVAVVEGGQIVLRGRVRDEASKIGLVSNVGDTLFEIVVDELEIDPYAPLPPERLALSLSGAALFAPDSPQLLASAHESLDVAVRIIGKVPGFRLVIRGHTDNQGGVDHNFRLATARGEAVFDYLVGAGIDPDRLRLEPRGQLDPIADNSTETGRKKNRRVELVLIPD